MFIFQKIWCALFSCNTLFEIRFFALLPSNLRISGLHLSYFRKQKNLEIIRIECEHIT